MIRAERVYGHLEADGTRRYLVDRLWPRGIKKEALHIDGWPKDGAPSNELRRWYGHDPDKEDEFRKRYFAELEANPGAWQPLLEAARHGDVTLLYSSTDAVRNNAIVLSEFLEQRLR